MRKSFLAAVLALPLFGTAMLAPALAQAPATGTVAPTTPPAASSSVPATIGRPVTPPLTPSRAGTAVTPSTSTGAVVPAASPGKMDVNTASETDLATLPGVGPVTAKAIVAGRPWDSLDALSSKKVMNRPTFERNKERLALANINTSTAADMAKTLPGIGAATAPKIVDGRPYATPQDLVTKKVLTAAQLAKIKDLIAY